MESFGKHGSKGSLDWKKVEFVQTCFSQKKKKKEEREGFIERSWRCLIKQTTRGGGKKNWNSERMRTRKFRKFSPSPQ